MEITATVKVTKEYDESKIWDALVGSDFVGCQDFIATMSCDWEDKWAPFPITYYLTDKRNKEGYYEEETRIFTKAQIFAGFKKAVQSDSRHCGGHSIDDLEDYDACFAYIVLQFAIYGEVLFG
jgi:hypothetical protein